MGRLNGINRVAFSKGLWASEKTHRAIQFSLRFFSWLYMIIMDGSINGMDFNDYHEIANNTLVEALNANGISEDGITGVMEQSPMADWVRAFLVKDRGVGLHMLPSRPRASGPWISKQKAEAPRTNNILMAATNNKRARACDLFVGEPIMVFTPARGQPPALLALTASRESGESGEPQPKRRKITKADKYEEAWRTYGDQIKAKLVADMTEKGDSMKLDEVVASIGAIDGIELGNTFAGADLVAHGRKMNPAPTWFRELTGDCDSEIYWARKGAYEYGLRIHVSADKQTRKLSVAEVFEIIKSEKGESEFSKEYVKSMFDRYATKSKWQWKKFTVTKKNTGGGGNSFGGGNGTPLVKLTGDMVRLRRDSDPL